jgi:hypothetical protein
MVWKENHAKKLPLITREIKEEVFFLMFRRFTGKLSFYLLRSM